jgi:hypothetical protein
MCFGLILQPGADRAYDRVVVSEVLVIRLPADRQVDL